MLGLSQCHNGFHMRIVVFCKFPFTARLGNGTALIVPNKARVHVRLQPFLLQAPVDGIDAFVDG